MPPNPPSNSRLPQLAVWSGYGTAIVRSTLTFGSFAKYSANLITSERASVTWNKLETFLTNNTITETLNKKSFS